MRHLFLTAALLLASLVPVDAQTDDKAGEKSGNPLFKGWYADPEGVVFGDQYWIYPTYSAPYDEQTFLDAFSSKDLVHWQKHPRIISTEEVGWIKRAMWAPAIVRANGKYYLFFAGNDIKNDQQTGGIGVAVADSPAGPFRDALGKPLIGRIVNGAQPIDQFVFRDDDGTFYMYYGGWGRCNMVRLAPDLLSIVPFHDGELYKEVTPRNYTEGPFMLKRQGKYYFMWSEGGWGNSDYCVAYAIADSPFGPFERVGKILEQDDAIAKGAGHHSVIQVPGKDEWYIVYHRRPLTETAANSRETCIDRLYFDAEGRIRPVKMTREGVGARPIAPQGTYLNPVVNYSLPDPTVIRDDDGWFYLYATENIRNVPIHRSRNLTDWEFIGTAFTDRSRPTFEEKGSVWAPDINKIGDRYVMYYSMSRWGGEWTCGIGIAVADRPEGPFEDRGKLFRSNEIGIQNCIDPFYIEDNGKRYLFWGSFHGIYGAELTDDGLALKPGAEPVRIAGDAYEGTYIHKRGKHYYLFASTGRCCEGLKSTYATVVGRSENLFGPYVDKQGRPMAENRHEVLIHGNYDFVGPGHNAEIVADDKEQEWILYHAFSRADPKGRVLMMDRVIWEKGWPRVEGDAPSLKAQAPVFKKASAGQAVKTPRKSGRKGRTVRLTTYNVGVFNKYIKDDYPLVAGILKENGAESVCLNELDSCTLRTGGVFQLERIAAMMGGWGFRYGAAMPYQGGKYGIGIMTREKILDSFTVPLPKGEGSETRMLVVVELPDYVLATTHLDYRSKEAQQHQAELINRVMQEKYGNADKPVFLTGDMNARPDTPTLDILRQAWTVLSATEPGTIPSDAPRACIDYILQLKSGKPCKVLETHVMTSSPAGDIAKASDHLPVTVELRLPKRAAR